MCRIISDLWIARKGNIKKKIVHIEKSYMLVYIYRKYTACILYLILYKNT